jgi:hypothetical protein
VPESLLDVGAAAMPDVAVGAGLVGEAGWVIARVVGATLVVGLVVVEVVEVEVLDVRVVGDSVVVVVREVELVEASPVVAAVLVGPGALVTAPGAEVGEPLEPLAEVLVRADPDGLLDPQAPRTSAATTRTKGATRRQ